MKDDDLRMRSKRNCRFCPAIVSLLSALLFIMVVLTLNDNLLAQEDVKATEINSEAEVSESTNPNDEVEEEKKNKEETATHLPLPKNLPDGRPLRPIALFSSQMDVLVSKNYMPVSIDQLRDALVNQQTKTGESLTNQIIESEYVVELLDSKLVCRRGWLRTSPEIANGISILLGEQGVSLRSVDAAAILAAEELTSRFEFDGTGEAFATIPANASAPERIQYLWTCRGELAGNAFNFKLRLPLVERATFFVAVPSGKEIVSVNAVVSRLAQVESEISSLVQNDKVDWYRIEAGGTSELNLRVTDSRSVDTKNPVLRRAQMQCEVNESGMEWTRRFILEQHRDVGSIEALVQASEVLSVKINGDEVPFTLANSGDFQKLTVTLSNAESGDESGTKTLSIQGFTKTNINGSWIDLPNIMVTGCVPAITREEIQLSIQDPLQVVGWQVPSLWTVEDDQLSVNGYSLVRATGPLRRDLLSITDIQSAGRDSLSTENTGSGVTTPPETEETFRIMLSQDPAESLSTVDLRLEVEESVLRAKARMSFKLDEQRASPITLQLENQWQLDSLRIIQTNRLLPLSLSELKKGKIQVWLEEGDVREGELELLAEGYRDLSISRNRLTLPSSWFIRTEKNERSKLLASITPTPTLTWSGLTALEQSRLWSPDLNTVQQEFFGIGGSRTLWFQPDDGTVPSIELVRPSVAFSAKSRIFLDVEDDQVVERLQLTLESQSQSIESVEIQTDSQNKIPNYQWSLQNEDGTNFSQLDVVRVTVSEDGRIQKLDLKDLSLASRRLIARRTYPLSTAFKISLPTILGSTAQDAEVFLGPSLQLTARTSGISIIPVIETVFSNPFQSQAAQTAQPPSNRWVRLRYDPVNQPSISLKPVNNQNDINVVWKERVRCISSLGGTESLHAEYDFLSNAELQITTPQGWDLVSVVRSGELVERGTWVNGVIRLPATFIDDTASLVWRRKADAGFLVRSSEIPRIEVRQAAIMSSQYRFFAMPDSFVLNQLKPEFRFGNAVRERLVRSGESVLLCRYEHILAFGCLMALGIFTMTVWIGRRTLFGLVVILSLALATGFFWLHLLTAYYAWVVIPVVCGGLLAVATARKSTIASAQLQESELKATRVARDDDFSFTQAAARTLLLVVIWSGNDQLANAQDSAATQTIDLGSAIDVLVPVDAEGDFSGEMVYVPRDLYSELFSKNTDNSEGALRFLSANYRLQISQQSEPADSRLTFQSVEAEYLLRIEDGRDSAVTIPILHEMVRRVELLGDTTRILPFEKDGQFIQLVTSPNETVFRIRVTFKPLVSPQDSWFRMELPIPLIANAKVSIESEVALSAVRLGGDKGWLMEEQANLSRTWVDDLGPVQLLQVDVRSADQAQSNNDRVLGRRYWVRAGETDAVVDCEIDVPENLARGEYFQFVILDSKMPRFIGDSWRFVGSELYSPSRRLVTMQCSDGQDNPVRMVWTESVDWVETEGQFSRQISIPEVIAAALGENADPWIALQCEPSMQFLPVSGAENEPLSVDQFLANWSGYRGTIDRAFVPVEGMPELSLKMKDPAVPFSLDQQIYHAHLTQTSCDIHYRANLLTAKDNGGFARLFIGDDLGVSRISVNGVAQVVSSKALPDGTEYYVQCQDGGNPAVIEIFGSLAVTPNDLFSLPDIHFAFPISRSKVSYLVTQDFAIQVTGNQKSRPLINSITTSDPVWDSWVPIDGKIYSSWIESANLPLPELNQSIPTFSISPGIASPRVDQLISISRIDRRWTMNSRFRFLGKNPTTVCLELPEELCDEMTIEGGEILRTMPAIEQSRMVLQILLNDNLPEQNQFSVSSQVSNLGRARFGLPRVTLLGATTRQVFAAVPKSIDAQKAIWRTSAVNRATIPDFFGIDLDSDEYQVYRATNQSYSIDLAPISEDDTEPLLLCTDAHVFPDDTGLLVLMHWDIYPGDDGSVRINLPESTQVLAAWINEKPFVPDLNSSENLDRFDLPFTVDRYSQTVQLLVRTELERDLRNADLPKIGDLRAAKQWLTLYRTKSGESPAPRLKNAVEQDRFVSLAESVIQSVAVIGNAGQFDESDMRAWLTPWVNRYSVISRKAGVSPQWMSQQFEPKVDISEDIEDKVEIGSKAATIEPSARWSTLNKQLNEQIEKFPSVEGLWNQQKEVQTLFPVEDFEGYEIASVSEYDADRVHGVIKNYLLRQKDGVVPLLPVLMFGLLGTALIWIQRNRITAIPFVANPSIWLLMLGISCWVVMPVPVGAGIAAAALLVPLFSNSRYMNWLSSHLRE